MRNTGDDDQRMRCKGDSHRVEFCRRTPHDGQIDLVAGEQASHRIAIVDQQPDPYVRVGFTELSQQARRKVLGSARHSDRDSPALEAFQRQQRLIRLPQRLQDLTRMVEQDLAGLGQKDTLANPFEQQGPADLLQLLDLQRDGRVRQMQVFGCACKRQMAGGYREDLKLTDGGVSHRLSFVNKN